MRTTIKWMAVVGITAATMSIAACNSNKDFGYDGSLDLNLLAIKQARTLWDGSECNVTTSLMKSDNKVANFTYTLNLALYQERKAGQSTTVNLVADADTLAKAIARAAEGGVYEKYTGASLLPAECCLLSSDKMELLAGRTTSEDVELTVYSEKLISLTQEAGHDMRFVLPLRIKNPTSYAVNEKVNTLMFIFNVAYVDEKADPDRVADMEGVPEDDELDGGYKLLWHDEFNETGAPDAAKWRFETGFQRNEEDQWYQAANTEMKDGALVITAKEERIKNPNYNPNATGGNAWKQTREYAEYTSSCVVAKTAFKYGKLVVRAKVPIDQGAWPAIWSTGNWYEWPLGGEIDIMEFYKEKIHANLCWGGSSRWNGTWNSKNYSITDFTSKDAGWADKYHIWTMDWDKDYIRIYLDGKLLNETDLRTTVNKGDHGAGAGAYVNPFSNDYSGFGQVMMLNLAIGGVNGRPVTAVFPLEYRVDYIRIYQKK